MFVAPNSNCLQDSGYVQTILFNMERNSGFKELFPTSTPELLAVFGRGASFYTNIDGNERYKPTGLIMKYDFMARDEIPEIDLFHPLTGEEDNSVVGGGNSNVLAAIHFLRNLEFYGQRVKEIVFSAGRPPYLQKLSDHLTEGDLMIAKFERLKKYYDLPSVPVFNFRENKNTWDDIQKTLELAKSKCYKKIAIIQIDPLIPRIKEFLSKINNDNSKLCLDIEVLNSWQILSLVSPHYESILKRVKKTSAHRKTIGMEERGTRMIKDGSYIYRK